MSELNENKQDQTELAPDELEQAAGGGSTQTFTACMFGKHNYILQRGFVYQGPM